MILYRRVVSYRKCVEEMGRGKRRGMGRDMLRGKRGGMGIDMRRGRRSGMLRGRQRYA